MAAEDSAQDIPRSIPLGNMSERPKISLHNATRDNRYEAVEQHLRFLPRTNRGRVLNHKDGDGYAPIHYAAKFNRFKIMSRLILAGADFQVQTEEEKYTPLHFASRYQPRYHDDDIERQEYEEDVDSGAPQVQRTEEDVSYLASSKKVMKLLVKNCEVDVNPKALYGITPLHLACQRGNKIAVAILLKTPRIEVNIEDDNKDTPLHEACQYGETEIVEMLLKKMKDDNNLSLALKNDEEQTPLHNACREGYVDIVKLILKYGFEQRRSLVSALDNENSTPLHLACENGNEEIVRLLLLNGADMLQPKDNGITPIHVAARFGFVSVLKTLMQSGENIVDAVDIYEQTPLHYAARFDKSDMIDYLLDNGADIEALDVDSYSPLMTAAWYGQVLAFKKLLDRGSQTDVLDKNNASIVFLAAEYNHVSILKIIVRHSTGAKLCGTPDSSYNTPLHIAAQKGHLSSVRALISSSMNYVKLDAKNELNKTPMHLAAENGHVPVVRELIQHRIDTIADEDEDGNTPLHLACIRGYPGVARVLLNAKADVEARNATLWTPMDCAAHNGHEQLVEMLIDAEADIDPTDKLKTTPLHLASQEGHLNVVNTLLKHKANVGNVDQQGFNALDLAIENGHEEVAMAIIQSKQWKNALRNTTINALGVETTPLRKLIRKMPEVAEEVFNRCSSTNATSDGKIRPDSKEYEVTFDYEFLEDYQDPVSAGSKLRRALTKSHQGEYGGSDSGSEKLIGEVGGVESQHQGFGRGKTTTLDVTAFGFMSDQIMKKGFTTDWGPEGFKKSNHPLSIMVESERTDLLKHPLVTSLLQNKWGAYGRLVFYGNLLLYITFLAFLTSFALVLANPGTVTCETVFNSTFGSISNSSDTVSSLFPARMNLPDTVTGLEFCMEKNTTLGFSDEFRPFCGECVISSTRRNFLFVAAIIVIFLATIRLIFETFQLLQLRDRYIFDWVNWMEAIMFLCSIIFAWVFNTECRCATTWQWQIGAIAVFLAWIDLIIFMRKLPLTGIYVLMLVDIFYTFMKMIIVTGLLVIAFSLAFYMAFFEPGFRFSRSPFSSPGRAIVKTITMTTGEFEFDGIFRQTPGGLEQGNDELPPEIPFLPISFLLWIIFIILMPILLTNLLVGLAVDDIKGIQEAAVLKRLALQVELALSVEELFPSGIRRRFIVGGHSVKPNRSLGLYQRFRYRIWGKDSERFDSPDNLVSALHPTLTPLEQIQAQTRSLVHSMAKMKDTINDLNERNQLLESFIRQMAQKQGITAENLDEKEDDREDHYSSI